MINILLNGKQIEVKEGSTIADLIKLYDLDVKKVAVEKDLEIILVDDFDKTKLTSDNRIEIVHFIGGG